MKTRSLPHRANTETFSDFITFYDDDGELLDIADIDEITVRVRDPDCNATLLEATLTGADIVETGDGTVQFTFTADQMGALCPGQYQFGVTVTIDGVTEQTHLQPLPIIRGL